MPITLGRRYAAAPPFAPHRFGLLSVADYPAATDPHWQGGVDTQPNPCDEAGSALDHCPPVTGAAKSATADGFPTWGAEPFAVFAQIPCSPVGIHPEMQSRTVSALRNGEGRAVERVFWTGSTLGGTVNPHLAADAEVLDTDGTILQTAATVVVTGAPGVVLAMGELEGALAACYGGEGVIHVPAAAVAHLANAAQLVKDGERLRTWIGNRVAVYASNNREGPTGAEPAAGNYWFYATGAVSVRQSEVMEASSVNDALDRSNNTLLYIAERTYVINHDCCHLAVQVNLSS